MAASDEIFRPMEVFWTCDGEDGILPISGKNTIGNHCPPKLKACVKGKKTKEVEATIPKKQPIIESLSPGTAVAQQLKNSGLDMTKGKASLKDLCSEDKQRIANLIKELAKLGEEKENVREQFDAERHQFEAQLEKVVQQQNRIFKEREVVQLQLQECQASLEKYQKAAKQQTKEEKQIGSKKHVKNCRKAELYTPPRSNSPQPDSKSCTAISSPRTLPSEPQERPFTQMIDKLIEQEKTQPPSSSVISQSATNGSLEFHPLQPDQSSEQTGTMTEQQFMTYYKQLSPFERKKQLQVQKAALLEEQRYLKSLLVQQEKLLQAKQDQLHMQQDLQQERLRYFERTGRFPPHDPRLKLPYLEHEPFPIRDNNVPQVYTEQQQAVASQQCVMLTNRDMNAAGLYQCNENIPPTPLSGPFPETPAECAPAEHRTTQSFKGRPVPVFHPQIDEAVEVEKVSVATSPLHPSRLHPNRDKRQYTDHFGPVDDDEDSEVMSEKYSEATDLLDIVDEVESLHSSTAYAIPSNTHTQYMDRGRDNSVDKDDDDDDLEESRVLEEVFFVK